MIKLSFLTETGNYLEYYINPAKVNCIKTLRDNSDSISGELEIVLDNKTLKFLKTDLSVVNTSRCDIDFYFNIIKT